MALLRNGGTAKPQPEVIGFSVWNGKAPTLEILLQMILKPVEDLLGRQYLYDCR